MACGGGKMIMEKGKDVGVPACHLYNMISSSEPSQTKTRRRQQLIRKARDKSIRLNNINSLFIA